MRQKVFVTGGAGFVGSNIVDRLLERFDVVVFDNFSTGFEGFLANARNHSGFSLVRGDMLDQPDSNAGNEGLRICLSFCRTCRRQVWNLTAKERH